MRVTVNGSKGHQLEDQCILGRDESCNVVIPCPRASRKHAAIQRTPDGAYLLFDLASSQGTFVDGKRVTSAVIRSGTRVTIGDCVLVFDGGSSATRSDVHDLRLAYEHLRAAHELNEAIGVEQDPDRMMDRILDAAFQLLAAERAAIVLIDQGTQRPAKQVSRSRDGSNEELIISRTLLAEVITGKRGVISADAGSDARFSRSESISIDGIRSAMCVPLLYQDELLGVMVVDSLHAINAFQRRDLDLFTSIASQAALVLKNISLRTRMQSFLEDERARLERILQGLPAGVLLFDADRTVVRSNVVGAALLARLGKRSVEEMIARAGRGPFELESDDDPKLICLVSGAAIEEQFLLSIQDVTEQRLRERNAGHAQRLAMVGQLTGALSHDFNNLLSIVLMLSGMLREELPPGELRDQADGIHEAATRGERVIRQLLVFSRRDHGMPELVDAGVVIEEMQRLLASAVQGGATLEVKLARTRRPVLIEKVALEQILMNLVTNARDAVGERGLVTISTGELSFDRPTQYGGEEIPTGRYFHLSVSDDGCGMPVSVAERIFEPFFTTKEAGRGTGLGLSTVYGLVKRAGGWIWVDSKPNAGTRMNICLPHADSAELAA